MIVAGSGLRVVVATRPVDFRKGHDRLVAVVEHELGLDPYSSVVFVFRPKRVRRVLSDLDDDAVGQKHSTGRRRRRNAHRHERRGGFSGLAQQPPTLEPAMGPVQRTRRQPVRGGVGSQRRVLRLPGAKMVQPELLARAPGARNL